MMILLHFLKAVSTSYYISAMGGEVTVATTSTYYYTWLLISATGTVTFNGQFTLLGAGNCPPLDTVPVLITKNLFSALYVAGTFNQYGLLTGTPSLRSRFLLFVSSVLNFSV